MKMNNYGYSFNAEIFCSTPPMNIFENLASPPRKKIITFFIYTLQVICTMVVQWHLN